MTGKVAALALALASVTAACGGGAGGAVVEMEDFEPAAFTARLESSERPLVVNVWASWCIPCRDEIPLLVEAHHRHGDRVDFVGVDVEDHRDAAADFAAEHGVTYELWYDPQAEVRSVLGGAGVPITYFVAPGGEVVDTHFGEIDAAGLEAGLERLLP